LFHSRYDTGKLVPRRFRKTFTRLIPPGGLLELTEKQLTKGQAMLVVHVRVQVKPEAIEAFKQATLANAKASIQEPGIARFDVLQQHEDPAHFVLVEVYRTAAAPAAHKETAHYAAWRDAVAPMMAVPRSSVRYGNLFPEDEEW
jgi:autoinducer 2-degrading protein